MADPRNQECAKRANSYLKANPQAFILHGTAIFFLLLIAALLAMLSVGLSLIWCALIVLPYLFALTATLQRFTEENKMPENRLTMQWMGNYFRRPFFGCYRAIINFLKAFGISMAVEVASLLIMASIFQATSPDFAKAMESSLDCYLRGDIESALSILDGSEIVNLWVSIASVIGVGVLTVVLAHFLGNYAMSPMMKFATGGIPPALYNNLYNKYFQRIRSSYRHLKWRYGRGIQIVLPLSVILGAVLGFALKLQVSMIWAICIGLFALALAVYLPHYLLLNMAFFLAHKKEAVEANIDSLKDFLSQISRLPDAPKEAVEELRKTIQSLEESLQNTNYSEEEPL